MARRKEIKELYYIRAIAAMGILLIHASAGFAVNSEFGSKAMYLGILTNQFFRFGSPIFMMVSGLVLFYNYRSMDEFDTKKFYKKKIKFILLPYIIWSAIYFLYRSYLYKAPLTLGKLLVFGRELLLGESFSHLYFIFLIFQFYVILPLLIRYLTRYMKKHPFRIFSFCLIVQGAILIYGYYFKNPNATGVIKIFNLYYWKTVFGWFFYFMTGGLLGMHYEEVVNFVEKHIKKLSIAYAIVTFLYVGQVYYNVWINGGRDYYGRFGSIRPHTMIYAIFTMPILIWLTRKIVNKFNLLKNFGTYSFGIYFVHPLILEELKRILMNYLPNHIGHSRLSSLVFICGMGILISFAFVLAVGSTNIRWLFIGKVPRYKLKTLRKGENV
ncbi:acyltransferase [Schnuerera sp. xch1]|uniref:acyltransferase n=1 Tax=Schnuerera sp. xch1 TaxID=2874283 RepID=UPI001CBD7C78|nr:acyltransferase [Schnuerera sp. xch1]MBZ2175014.1 acyltransferase [Schnuerera sp. xch1]